MLKHQTYSLRHGRPICSGAPRSQSPKPHRGAPEARGLTASDANRATVAIDRKEQCLGPAKCNLLPVTVRQPMAYQYVTHQQHHPILYFFIGVFAAANLFMLGYLVMGTLKPQSCPGGKAELDPASLSGRRAATPLSRNPSCA